MQKVLSLVALVSLLVCSVSSVQTGIAFGVDSQVVEEFKNFMVPLVIEKMNSMVFPTISQDGFEISDMVIDILPEDVNNIGVGMNGADNSINFVAQNLGMTVKGNWKYKLFLITYHGSFEADIEQNGAQISFSVPVTHQTNAGKLLPAIEVTNMYLNINKDKVDIKLSGSVVADVVNLFVWLFQNVIVNIICNVVDNTVPDMVSSVFNQAIYNTGGVFPLFAGLAFDFSLQTPITISDTQMDVYMNATFFNDSYSEIVPSTVAADVTIVKDTVDYVQADVTSYTADSLFLTLHNAGWLHLSISNDSIPELTTTMLDLLLPGLTDKYGSGVGMIVDVRTKNAPRTVFNNDEIGMIIDLEINFEVVGQGSAAIIDFIDTEALLSLTMSNFTLYPKIEDVSFHTLTVVSSNIGKISTTVMKTELNVLMSTALPIINRVLAGGIPVPQSLFGLVEIEDASFKANEDFLSIMVSPNFTW